jgi:hypothetical protein
MSRQWPTTPHLIPSAVRHSGHSVQFCWLCGIWPGKINELVGKGISYDDSFQVDGCLSERRLFSEGALSFCFFSSVAGTLSTKAINATITP